MQKMKARYYYSYFELYKKMFGTSFAKDFTKSSKEKKLWYPAIKLARLGTLLDVMVTLDWLKTGTEKGTTARSLVAGKLYDIEQTLYYALKAVKRTRKKSK